MPKLIEDMLGFFSYCRNAGFKIGSQESIESIKLIEFGFIKNKQHFKSALKAVLCTSYEEWLIFNRLFDNYWSRRKNGSYNLVENHSTAPKKRKTKQINNVYNFSNSIEENSTEGDTAPNKVSASAVEKLKKTDFKKIHEVDSLFYDMIAQQFYNQMLVRLSKKYKSSKRRNNIDIRKTIRQNLKYGGNPIMLSYKYKIKQKRELLVFADVSGSMDEYSFHFLKFMILLHNYFDKINTFIFSTKLINITPLLNQGSIFKISYFLEDQAKIWSSGTTMGNCLHDFNHAKTKRILSKRPVVLFFSDGLETGDPDLLYDEIKIIKNNSKKILWINPLIGMKNYQPITKAMSKILPLIDEFRPGHNMDSLLHLERYLANAL